MFQAGGKSIPFTIVESARAKYIRLVINADGLRAIKPKHISTKAVHKFMQDKSEWIVRHYSDYEASFAKKTAARWSVGDGIKYLGEEYAVRVSMSNNARTSVKFDGHEFEVKLGIRIKIDDANEAINEATAEALKAWLVRESGQYFISRLNHYCKLMGLEFNRVTIREQKTRWGSCSRKSNLNFNWKLITAPPWIIDYVIVHEACHLRHMNHSKEFWEMVAAYIKEYKTAKAWLKENGAVLGFRSN